MLSIIIPTLNEEKYLSLLIESIKEQNFSDYEIILADAGSEDKTLEIAKKYNCKVAKGGIPAKGRNQGASIARGDLFLFLDAEARLPQYYLQQALEEFSQRNLDIASCALEPITDNRIFKKGYHFLYNQPARLLENIFPYASNFILVKRKIHEKLGGFDEKIKMAEDHSYARKAAKIGRYGFLRIASLPFLPLRNENEGWLKISFKFYFCNLCNILFGDVKSDIFKYHFGQYKGKKSPKKKKNIFCFFQFILYPLWITAGFVTWPIIFLIFLPKITYLYFKK